MIKVMNLNDSHELDDRFLRNLVTKILKLIGRPRNTQLEVVFLSDKAIRAFNKRYAHRDRATDVLSFNMDLPACWRGREGAGDSASFGELLISSDTALRN